MNRKQSCRQQVQPQRRTISSASWEIRTLPPSGRGSAPVDAKGAEPPNSAVKASVRWAEAVSYGEPAGEKPFSAGPAAASRDLPSPWA